MTLNKKHPELVFEKKNKDLKRLPKYARIEKRPVPHPPAASPYAGAQVPKVVYVSSKTPFMSAVKRVQKLLKEAEKRAMAKVSLRGKSEKQTLEQLKEGSAALQKEEVFVKASGRAIEKTMNIGKWFDEKEEYGIRVKTGSVLVVDDIAEDEKMKEKLCKRKAPKDSSVEDKGLDNNTSSVPGSQKEENDELIAKRRSSNKGERGADSEYGAELPESRTRWVKTVEIAVILK